MKLNIARTPAVMLLILLCSAPAHSQSVSDVLTFLVTNQSVATGSVERDRAAAQAASDTISRALLASLATLPVSTSSGAFVYRLNPTLGTVERATQTFGPFFVERALTAGRRGASLALTFQRLRFTELDRRSLRDGTLVTTANQFVDETAPFDVDRLTLNIAAEVATLYANAGITDRLELGAALPIVALHMNGTRVDTYRAREFTQAAASSARAVGIADTVARAKYTVYEDGGAAVGAAVDARFPTGRSADLLGTAATSIKVSGIGSLDAGWVALHANVGLSRGGLERELTYGGAATLAAGTRLTISGELVGRWIPDAGRLTFVTARHPTLSGVETIRLASTAAGVHLVSIAPGIKWNVGATWMLVANLNVPLTHQGLTAPTTPFVGLEYTIAR